MDHPQELTILSLCTGYGGLELGLARALENRMRVVAVEIEAFALANLEAKAASGALAIEALWPNLKTFPAEKFRGCFDFLVAGYPCQPFSVSGKRKGAADERSLWGHIARIVRAVQPEFVLLENVAGHLSLGVDRVILELAQMGYGVAADLFGALEAGTGIDRGDRIFVLAQAACRRRSRVELSIRPGRSHEAQGDTSGKGAVLGQTDNERFQDERWEPKEATGGRGQRVAPQGVYQYPWEFKRFVEPRLGRTAYGHSARVDRVRLCGGGVCPPQAEIAFRTLYEAIINNR